MADSNTNANAATKKYTDDLHALQFIKSDSNTNANATTKKYVDDLHALQYIMSDSNTNANATTKKYVDDAISGVGSSLWTDDGSSTYLTIDSEPLELRKTGFAHGMTALGSTDMYGRLKIGDGTHGGVTMYGITDYASDHGISFRAVTTQATPTIAPMNFSVGDKSATTWGPLGAGKLGFEWKNSSLGLMSLNTSAYLSFGGESPYHQISVYDANSAMCLTDSDINTKISSASEAQDTNAVYILTNDVTPEIGISGGDGDNWGMTIDTDDGAVFENATTYNFDAPVIATRIQLIAGDTTGVGSTAAIGTIVYKTSDAHFYGLKGGTPPTWVQLEN